METNVNYTIVGIFVLSLFACMVFGIIWLSSGLAVGQYTTYKIYMKESVAGLNVDSSVEFNGVPVGSVKSIEINSRDPHIVTLLLSIKNTTPVTNGTRATLNTKGLTGIAYVALVDQGNNLSPITILPNEEYPIIETAPSLFWRLDTGMKKISEHFFAISKALEKLLDPQNLLAIKEILIETQKVTNNLANNTEKINALLDNAAKVSKQLPPLLQSSQNAMKLLNAQILPNAHHTLSNLDILTTNLAELAIDLKQNPAIIIRGKTPPILGPGE